MEKSIQDKIILYFRAPLYRVSAMTSYNMPNSLVHIPVVLMLAYIGVCVAGAGIKPLLAVYFAVALYIARDLVHISYRNRTVPLVIWGIFVPFIAFKKQVAGFLTFSLQDSIVVTLALLALFLLYVPIYIKKFL